MPRTRIERVTFALQVRRATTTPTRPRKPVLVSPTCHLVRLNYRCRQLLLVVIQVYLLCLISDESATHAKMDSPDVPGQIFQRQLSFVFLPYRAAIRTRAISTP